MEKNYELKKMMVCLDLSEMDEPLLKFASYISRMMNSDKAYFVHVVHSLDMPDEVRKKYPDLQAPLDETIKKELESSIRNYFQAREGCTIETEIRKGNASDQILKLAENKDADLIVLGKKTGLAGRGVIPGKLARVAHRSILMVPEILPKVMDRLLVPIDFSKHALLALRQAIRIKETSDMPLEISCVNVYHIPSGWYKTGKSEEEFSEIMKKHAMEDYQKFLKSAGLNYQDIPCEFVLDTDDNPAQKIYQQAVRLQSDIIILGSKGKTAAATVLMGSNAERLADYDKNIPLLVVKDKNENIGFLQALFKL